MKNKTVLITGPTSGVGKEIAIQLGKQGADLILACRDVKRGKQAAKDIAAPFKAGRKRPGQIDVRHVDMSSRRSIRKFAQEVRDAYPRLDVLINNAATNRGQLPRATSVDGIELTFATNVLGYFLLTRELQDTLIAGAPARLINVASQFASDLDLDDLEFERRPFEAAKAYAQSKACDRLLTWAFARRLRKTGVTANAMTPGLIVDTGLYRDSHPGLVKRLRQYSSRTIADGADTAVWMATSPELEGVTGKFFVDRKKTPCEFRDKATEEKLWAICERLCEPV